MGRSAFATFAVGLLLMMMLVAVTAPAVALAQPTDPTGPADPADPKAQPAADDNPGPLFPEFLDALRAKNHKRAAAILATTPQRMLCTLAPGTLNRIPGVAGPLKELLDSHAAAALATVPGSLEAITAELKVWDTKHAGIKNVEALLVSLFDLGASVNSPMIPPPPPNMTFKPAEETRRGTFAWVNYKLIIDGQERNNSPCIYQKIDGKWRLLAFNMPFAKVASDVLGGRVESPAHYDAIGTRITRERLRALEKAILALPAAPASKADQSSAPLVAALPDLPADMIRDGQLIDGWDRPMHYAGKTPDAPFTVASGGADGEFGNEDDERTRRKPSAEPEARPRVEFVTNKGRVVIELYEDEAPNSVSNFIRLVESKFYDGTKFHRIVDKFMIQGGDPVTRTGQGMPGTGDAGYSLPDERTPQFKFDSEGILAYANSGPNTSSCQFFITLAGSAHLNDRTDPRTGQPIHYTILGKVVEGIEVVMAIGKTPVRMAPNGEPSLPTQDVVLETAKMLSKREHSYLFHKLPR